MALTILFVGKHWQLKWLKYLYFRGPIFHCDVSSNNIVLDGNLNARLIDFGINVALTQNQTSTRLSSTDQIPGKDGYMFTEQDSRITKRNDLYRFAIGKICKVNKLTYF